MSCRTFSRGLVKFVLAEICRAALSENKKVQIMHTPSEFNAIMEISFQLFGFKKMPASSPSTTLFQLVDERIEARPTMLQVFTNGILG